MPILSTARRTVGLGILLVLLQVGCRKTPQRPPDPEKPTSTPAAIQVDCAQTPRVCQEDRECVQVAESCCSCAMGGTDIAIHSSCRQAWLEKLGNCADVVCTAVFTCNPNAQPRCVAHRCELTGEAAVLPGEEGTPMKPVPNQ